MAGERKKLVRKMDKGKEKEEKGLLREERKPAASPSVIVSVKARRKAGAIPREKKRGEGP